MRGRWFAACVGLLVVLVVVAVVRTRGRASRTDSSSTQLPSHSSGDGAAATGPADLTRQDAHGRRRVFRPLRLQPLGGGTSTSSAVDRELAAMSEAIETSHTARTEAQRLAGDELGLDTPTREAIAAIFDDERQAVTGLEGTADATNDTIHTNLIEERKRRLAGLLGEEQAKRFHQAYTRYWIDALSAVYR